MNQWVPNETLVLRHLLLRDTLERGVIVEAKVTSVYDVLSVGFLRERVKRSQIS